MDRADKGVGFLWLRAVCSRQLGAGPWTKRLDAVSNGVLWRGKSGQLRKIIGANWDKFRHWTQQQGQQVRSAVVFHVAAMLACRTPKLGAHLFLCHGCGQVMVVPHSCKSVACSSCGKARTDAWCNELLSDLLDVPYRHLVFTIPWQLRLLLKDNRDVGLNILFRAAGDALLSLTLGTPRPLGRKSQKWLAGITKRRRKPRGKRRAKRRPRGRKRRPFRPGFLSVLHTYGSDLKWNPHLHVIVTGGGLSLDGTKWVAGPKRYLVPAPLLGTEWKLRVIRGVSKAHSKNPLYCRRLKCDRRRRLNVPKLLGYIRRMRWHILIGPSLRSADQAVRYAARYTKRPVIAEGRIIKATDEYVVYRFKDYHRGGKPAVKKLPILVFLDRLFQHFPERHFRQVRHYGLFSTRTRTSLLKTARQVLAQRKKRRPAAADVGAQTQGSGGQEASFLPAMRNSDDFVETSLWVPAVDRRPVRGASGRTVPAEDHASLSKGALLGSRATNRTD